MILLGCGLGFGLLGWPVGSRVAGAGSGACCCTSVVQLYACTSSLAHLPPPPLPAFGRPQVERVHIPRPKDGDTHSKFGFVHFRERAGAVRAVEDEEKPQLEGTSLTVSACIWQRGSWEGLGEWLPALQVQVQPLCGCVAAALRLRCLIA